MRETFVAPKSSESRASSPLLNLYREMLLIRLFELAAQASYRKGEMPGFIHLYIGEEAVAVGVCANLRSDDWITSTHRGHGHALAKGVSPDKVMAELFGRATGICGGRGGSMHLYDPSAGLFGTNGFVGGGIPAAVGIAIGSKSRRTDAVSVSFFGDGAANHASFHESVNFAGAQSAPVIFVCENNLYATATPLSAATRNPDIASRAQSYGIPGICVDGNDVLMVRDVTAEAVDRARKGFGPTLIEARTYRTVGHHEGDQLVGTYRTQEELDTWKSRCPIERFRTALREDHGFSDHELATAEAEVAERVNTALHFAQRSEWPVGDRALDRGWASFDAASVALQEPAATGNQTQTWLEAVRDGIAEEMRHDPNLLYFGEGTGERGGSFGHTKGLWQEFGSERLIDTPICELGFTGAAVGASATGSRTIADLMFADFIFEAASQVIEQAGKLYSMSNGQLTAPLLVRAGMGAIKNAGPHHSGSYHALWSHCPGLIVVVPSTPADAKGLIKSALRASDPVIFLEPKSLFATKGQVPEGEYTVPLGQAAVVRSGNHVTVVSAGSLVHRCLEAASQLEAEGISCEVVDLRTIVPLDVETVAESVIKTGRLLVVDEDFSACGIGAELAAAMMELAFDYLDAPVGRLHTEPIAHPFSPPLEEQIIVTTEKVIGTVRDLLRGVVPLPVRARPYRPLNIPRHMPTESNDECNTTEAPAPRSPVPYTAPRGAMEEVSEVQENAVEPGVVVMPNIGLTETEARVIAWRKGVGDIVTAGEALVDIQTDKVLLEVEAPFSGVLTEIFVQADEVAAMGQQLARIRL